MVSLITHVLLHAFKYIIYNLYIFTSMEVCQEKNNLGTPIMNGREYEWTVLLGIRVVGAYGAGLPNARG